MSKRTRRNKDKEMSKRWTSTEIELVKLNYEEISHEDLGLVLGRTRNAVRNLCYEMGLRKKVPNWTDEEIALMKEYYSQDELQLDELVERLGRPKTCVAKKAGDYGLTDVHRPASDDEKRKISDKRKRWHEENEHPRGHAGHTHSEETRKKISAGVKQAFADPNCRVHSEEVRRRKSDNLVARKARGEMTPGYSRGKMGKRVDLDNQYFRSSWEANYARYLNWLCEIGDIEHWEYEPDVFMFHEIKRGTRSYTPDFKVFEQDGSFEYIEIKGWMDPKSKTRLKRMAKYYPDVPLRLVDKDIYYAIRDKVQGFIANWE